MAVFRNILKMLMWLAAKNRGKVYDGAFEKMRKGVFPLSLLLAADTSFNLFSVTKLLRTFVSEREYMPWRTLFISILTETERI